MFRQIRKMMADYGNLLSCDVKVGEMYIHPDNNKRSAAKAHNSKVGFGMVERGGKAKAVDQYL